MINIADIGGPNWGGE